MLSKYGDRVTFLNGYSPDKQVVMCVDDRAAILAESPTLTDLKIVYGKNTAVMFLIPQLLNISEFCGAKDKFTDRQIEETAQLIAVTYPWLKVLEVMTFCKQFKMGAYGRFYGTVDPMVITCAIKDFLLYRKEVYADNEDILSRLRRAEEKKKPTMSYQEWKRLKEERGESVNVEMSVTEDKGETVFKPKPIETLVDMARGIVENKDNLSMKSLLDMRNMFRMNCGMSPEEVIEKSEKGEL